MVTTRWRGWKSRQDSLLPEWIIKRTSLSADDSDEFPDHLKVIGRIEFENYSLKPTSIESGIVDEFGQHIRRSKVIDDMRLSSGVAKG